MSRVAEHGVVRGKGAFKERTDRISLGLALLSLAAQPGVPLTHRDIAAWCECCEGAIHQIEQRALMKLRKRLLLLKDPVLKEVVGHFVGRAA